MEKTQIQNTKIKQNLYRNIELKPQNQASLIIDESTIENCKYHKLWLGSLEDAQNKKWLQKQGINAVFTVAIGQPISYTNNDIRHYEYPIEDKPIFKIQKYFPQILKLISKELGNTNVLVHCACGVSRSSTIVIAYLMKYKEMNFNQAYGYVKVRRPMIKPNNGFIEILRQL